MTNYKEVLRLHGLAYVAPVRHRESLTLDTCVAKIGQLRRSDLTLMAYRSGEDRVEPFASLFFEIIIDNTAFHSIFGNKSGKLRGDRGQRPR